MLLSFRQLIDVMENHAEARNVLERIYTNDDNLVRDAYYEDKKVLANLLVSFSENSEERTSDELSPIQYVAIRNVIVERLCHQTSYILSICKSQNTPSISPERKLIRQKHFRLWLDILCKLANVPNRRQTTVYLEKPRGTYVDTKAMLIYPRSGELERIFYFDKVAKGQNRMPISVPMEPFLSFFMSAYLTFYSDTKCKYVFSASGDKNKRWTASEKEYKKFILKYVNLPEWVFEKENALRRIGVNALCVKYQFNRAAIEDVALIARNTIEILLQEYVFWSGLYQERHQNIDRDDKDISMTVYYYDPNKIRDIANIMKRTTTKKLKQDIDNAMDKKYPHSNPIDVINPTIIPSDDSVMFNEGDRIEFQGVRPLCAENGCNQRVVFKTYGQDKDGRLVFLLTCNKGEMDALYADEEGEKEVVKKHDGGREYICCAGADDIWFENEKEALKPDLLSKEDIRKKKPIVEKKKYTIAEQKENKKKRDATALGNGRKKPPKINRNNLGSYYKSGFNGQREERTRERQKKLHIGLDLSKNAVSICFFQDTLEKYKIYYFTWGTKMPANVVLSSQIIQVFMGEQEKSPMHEDRIIEKLCEWIGVNWDPEKHPNVSLAYEKALDPSATKTQEQKTFVNTIINGLKRHFRQFDFLPVDNLVVKFTWRRSFHLEKDLDKDYAKWYDEVYKYIKTASKLTSTKMLQKSAYKLLNLICWEGRDLPSLGRNMRETNMIKNINYAVKHPVSDIIDSYIIGRYIYLLSLYNGDDNIIDQTGFLADEWLNGQSNLFDDCSREEQMDPKYQESLYYSVIELTNETRSKYEKTGEAVLVKFNQLIIPKDETDKDRTDRIDNRDKGMDTACILIEGKNDEHRVTELFQFINRFKEETETRKKRLCEEGHKWYFAREKSEIPFDNENDNDNNNADNNDNDNADDNDNDNDNDNADDNDNDNADANDDDNAAQRRVENFINVQSSNARLEQNSELSSANEISGTRDRVASRKYT
jgi:hypothetical protein